MNINNLKDSILRANKFYRTGELIDISYLTEDVQDFLGKKSGELSDRDYDKLIDKMKDLDPNDEEIFGSAVIENTDDLGSTERMQKLDKPMYSLEKKKTVAEVVKWANNKKIPLSTIAVITSKYDGVSALKNEKTKIAHSRGDGIEGQRITEHLEEFDTTPASSVNFYTIGELIIPRQVFEDNEFVRSGGEPYKNPRNMVAGLVNHDEVSPYWEFVDHIRYGVADEEFKYDKIGHIELIEKETGFKVPYEMLPLSELTKEFLDELYYKWGEKYEIDGLVIDINDKNLRKQLGRETNNNPSYAIAYKSDWTKPISTQQLFNDWDVSKEGYVKPVVNVVPFDTEGVTISRATGYNAKFIVDNKIGYGSTVEIIRSGSVIPKIVSVSKPTQADLPTQCPSCGTELIWNKSGVELMCTNDKCETMNIKKIAFFFSSLGVSDFGESIVTKFYRQGYDTVGKVLEMVIGDISKMDGMGLSSATKILTQFDSKVKNATFEKFGHASGCFENLGSRKLKMIVDGLGGMNNFGQFKAAFLIHGMNDTFVRKLEMIKGVAETTAISFLKGLVLFEKFMTDLGLEVKEREIIKSDISFEGRIFVFSGVRDADLQEFITDNGGDVKKSVSGNTTDLVVKDKNSTTAKVEKARKLGVNILQIDELRTICNM